MKLANLLGTSAALSALCFTSGAFAQTSEKTDPAQGKVTYRGSGSAERAPEYAEVWFTYSVGCRKSADDVREAIDKLSAPVWKAIVGKVSDKTLTETSRTYWGNIENVQESPGSQVIATPPRQTTTGIVAGTAKRVDLCAGKEVPLNAKVASVYSGVQRFGVRTSDMNWVESLARTVGAQPQGKATNDVKVYVSAPVYDVTLATKRAMFQETLNEAAAEATGTDSKFASDKRTLKYATAHYLGHKATNPAVYQPVVGESLARGKAPKVTLELPLVYTVYAEAKDVVDTASKKTVGLQSEYEVQGRAVVDADYAFLSVNLATVCHPKKEDATKALEATAKPVLSDLERFHGKREATETDRLVNYEPTTATEYYPYQPIAWDEKKPNSPVTKYLNLCSNEVVNAPASGRTEDLGGYFQAYQQLAVRSSNFVGVLDLAESLLSRHARATADTSATRVTVAKPVGQVTDATKRKLDIQARETATAFVLKSDGPLANDIINRKLVSAHLKQVREGQMGMSSGPAFGAAPRAASAGLESAKMDGGAPKDLQVDVVVKPNDQRPQFKMVRHFAFDYQFKTVDYAPLLNKPAPAPAPAPQMIPPALP